MLMFRTASKILLLLACLSPAMPVPGLTQDIPDLADTLPARVLFVTSGGYWEGTIADTPLADDAGTTSGAVPDAEDAAAQKRGYYRLIAIRGADNRSLLQLQQIMLAPDGPELATSVPVEEINSLGGYVTDIRPEDSTGSASQPGFAAYIYLKTDPSVGEPDTWALFIDEFGDVSVEQTTN
ncbi:hypothetical protein PZ897_02595 [Hoeflea sp. YIM 152468]|uniref:hypothetical protein n=1 Tax=Hoeflea sp. YIM 152468 TaxID=3031759 RepID=UPI0023DC2DF8|nr:hypothetical protein [Hoeflea sp. YIM 152468]MDF1607056.1 hypothetical protein [Hoeflea sp. YIM 152468]